MPSSLKANSSVEPNLVNKSLASSTLHSHYEMWAGTKTPHSDGWTYSRCDGCGTYWRYKSVTEYQDEAGNWSKEDMFRPKSEPLRKLGPSIN